MHAHAVSVQRAPECDRMGRTSCLARGLSVRAYLLDLPRKDEHAWQDRPGIHARSPFSGILAAYPQRGRIQGFLGYPAPADYWPQKPWRSRSRRLRCRITSASMSSRLDPIGACCSPQPGNLLLRYDMHTCYSRGNSWLPPSVPGFRMTLSLRRFRFYLMPLFLCRQKEQCATRATVTVLSSLFLEPRRDRLYRFRSKRNRMCHES
jgi:hypothetical protein